MGLQRVGHDWVTKHTSKLKVVVPTVKLKNIVNTVSSKNSLETQKNRVIFKGVEGIEDCS